MQVVVYIECAIFAQRFFSIQEFEGPSTSMEDFPT